MSQKPCWATEKALSNMNKFWYEYTEHHASWLDNTNNIANSYNDCLVCSLVKINWHFTLQRIRAEKEQRELK